MEEKDRKYFIVLMAMLGESFKEEMSTERGKIYFEFLQPYQLYEVSWAVKQAIQSLKFFPKVSELIELINPGRYEYIGENKELTNKKENEIAIKYITRISKLIGQKQKVDQIEYLKG